jgi:hypothetical protein
MTLSDLRKLSIRQQVKIHFRLQNGMECVVNELGVALVPGLHSAPDFNLDTELAGAAEFLLEPAPPSPPRSLRRDELATLAAASPAAAPVHDHDDD